MSKHLSLTVLWLCLIFPKPVYYCQLNNCSNLLKCEWEKSCPALDNSCTCYKQSLLVISIVCHEWSPKSFTFQSTFSRNIGFKIQINGLNSNLPFKFIQWFIPKLMQQDNLWDSVEISNFCQDHLKISNKLNLSQIFDRIPPYIGNLKLPNNCLDSVTGSMQIYNQTFCKFNLSFNKFTQIPKLLDGTDTLIKYNVSYNNVNTVSRGNFKKMLKLEQLDLSNNNLTSLPEDLLFDLQFLELFNISYNSISAIPKSFLYKNILLQKFDISNNNLVTLHWSTFQNSRTLVEIRLNNNKLKGQKMWMPIRFTMHLFPTAMKMRIGSWISSFRVWKWAYKWSYKLCLHNRDWRAGEFITDQIVRSVESSRRTIIVLTDNYLKSEWSRLEFDIAYQQGLKDHMRRLIVVVPNEVPDLSKIDQEFKTFITYVQHMLKLRNLIFGES
uniref:TIR domain-containing protein n=1 Tax=Strigamia maritima TaxID=126957 RepID=T1JAY7_STRMM